MAILEGVKRLLGNIADFAYNNHMRFMVGSLPIAEAWLNSDDMLVPCGMGLAVIPGSGRNRKSKSTYDYYYMTNWDAGGRQLVNRLASYDKGWVPLVRIATLPFVRSRGKECRFSRKLGDGKQARVYYVLDRQTRIGAGKALVDMHRNPGEYGKAEGPRRFSLDFDYAMRNYSDLRDLEAIANKRNGFLRPVRREAKAMIKQQKMAMRA